MKKNLIIISFIITLASYAIKPVLQPEQTHCKQHFSSKTCKKKKCFTHQYDIIET